MLISRIYVGRNSWFIHTSYPFIPDLKKKSTKMVFWIRYRNKKENAMEKKLNWELLLKNIVFNVQSSVIGMLIASHIKKRKWLGSGSKWMILFFLFFFFFHPRLFYESGLATYDWYNRERRIELWTQTTYIIPYIYEP